MSPSATKFLVAAAIVVVFAVAAAALLRDSRNSSKSASRTYQSASNSVDIRTARVATGSSRREKSAPAKKAPKEQPVTSGVKTAHVFPSQATETSALTGYTVDSFEGWTTFPSSYRFNGLSLRDGTIVLADSPATTAPRYGELVSPPLPLHVPAMAAPVAGRKVFPEGSAVELEFSLSRDGKPWSSWMAADAYRPPDGRRVRPVFQPQISEQEVDSLSTQNQETSSTYSGPFIRYRLSMSASGPASPAIADVRIWKREQN